MDGLTTPYEDDSETEFMECSVSEQEWSVASSSFRKIVYFFLFLIRQGVWSIPKGPQFV